MAKLPFLSLLFVGIPLLPQVAALSTESTATLDTFSEHPTMINSPGTKLGLRSWCILPEDVAKVEGPRDMSSCGTAVGPRYTGLKEIWLKRPGSKCCVAIVRVEPDGSVILNPNGFAYGPIPPLRDMTPEEADQLWTSDGGKSVTGKVTTYRLASYIKPNEAFIDLVFDRNNIQEYRIRSTEIGSANWHQVR